MATSIQKIAGLWSKLIATTANAATPITMMVAHVR